MENPWIDSARFSSTQTLKLISDVTLRAYDVANHTDDDALATHGVCENTLGPRETKL